MNRNRRSRTIAALAGSAFISTLGVSAAVQADTENPFKAQDLGSGYLLADKHSAEGKCGEGKCGAEETKESGEGKCGEGKCGASDAKGEAEGKCGEGKCGAA